MFDFYFHVENKMQTKMNVFKKKAIDCNLCPFSCFKNGIIAVRKNHKPNGWCVYGVCAHFIEQNANILSYIVTIKQRTCSAIISNAK